MASASTRNDLPGALDEDVRPIQREPGLPESNPDLEEGDWRGKGETDTGLTTLRDDTSLPTSAVKAITLSEDDPERKSELREGVRRGFCTHPSPPLPRPAKLEHSKEDGLPHSTSLTEISKLIWNLAET